MHSINVDIIIKKAGADLDEGGVKISGRNFNNLRYADYTICF